MYLIVKERVKRCCHYIIAYYRTTCQALFCNYVTVAVSCLTFGYMSAQQLWLKALYIQHLAKPYRTHVANCGSTEQQNDATIPTIAKSMPRCQQFQTGVINHKRIIRLLTRVICCMCHAIRMTPTMRITMLYTM